MASLIQRIQRFIRSPEGQRARTRAQQMARDPRNKARLQRLRARLGRRH